LKQQALSQQRAGLVPAEGSHGGVLSTNAVKMEMVRCHNMPFGHTVLMIWAGVIINSKTLELARAKGSNLWEQAKNEAEAIFLSPEQL
jgi:hypothetical protein